MAAAALLLRGGLHLSAIWPRVAAGWQLSGSHWPPGGILGFSVADVGGPARWPRGGRAVTGLTLHCCFAAK